MITSYLWPYPTSTVLLGNLPGGPLGRSLGSSTKKPISYQVHHENLLQPLPNSIRASPTTPFLVFLLPIGIERSAGEPRKNNEISKSAVSLIEDISWAHVLQREAFLKCFCATSFPLTSFRPMHGSMDHINVRKFSVMACCNMVLDMPLLHILTH